MREFTVDQEVFIIDTESGGIEAQGVVREVLSDGWYLVSITAGESVGSNEEWHESIMEPVKEV